MPSVIRGADNFDSGQVIGQEQTWQDVTASRASGVTYTNTTGKPIVVSAYVAQNYTTRIYIQIDGTTIFGNSGVSTTNFEYAGAIAIVPNGSTYQIPAIIGPLTWFELR